MADAFDTQAMPNRLSAAEAHANATRDSLMRELVTKSDFQAAMDTLLLRLTLRLGAMLAIGLAASFGILAIVRL